MRLVFYFCLLYACFVPGSLALADGRFFTPDKTPAGVPYQRALIIHEGGMEYLLLQSAYLLPETSAPSDIAWVVPVPDVPDLGALDSYDASYLFHRLARLTQPNVTWNSDNRAPCT